MRRSSPTRLGLPREATVHPKWLQDYNQRLSQRRADAVRDRLVQRGYMADLIQARGMGETNPIADNTSAPGRANNRRVEIVIERE